MVYTRCMNIRERERMSYEEGITRQAIRRKEEQAVRSKTIGDGKKRQGWQKRNMSTFYINCVSFRTDIKHIFITLILIPLTWN